MREIRRRAKEAIRQRIRAVRQALPAEARARRAALVAARVIALDEWRRARTVAVYTTMSGEVDTSALVEAARAGGRRVALPRVRWEAGTMTLHRWEVDAVLEDSGHGFTQPATSAPPVDPGEVDLILVPALAADPRGQRIGWGRGFYDRLLPAMPGAFSVALVYDFQIVAEVPDTPGDTPVRCVVSDGQVFRP